MSENSPDVQLTFDDERNRRTDELLAGTDGMLAIIKESQAQSVEQAMSPNPSLEAPAEVQAVLDERETERGREFDRLDDQSIFINPQIEEKLKTEGLQRPKTGEEIDAAEQAKDAEARAARKLAAEAHATKVHTKAKKSKVLDRRAAKPRAGRGGDKDVPERIGQIDGNRIIR
jgi:hypothetical protein